MRGGKPKNCLFAVREGADQPCGRADDQSTLLEPLAFGNQCVRPDEAFPTEKSAVQNSRSHSDQAIVRNRAAMEDGLMSDGHACAEGKRHSWIGMTDCTV